jgi:hypothetical protein
MDYSNQRAKVSKFSSVKHFISIWVLIAMGYMSINCTTFTDDAYRQGKNDNVSLVTLPPDSLNKFYKKHIDADGIPIVSSEKVSNEALYVARGIVKYMLEQRPDIRDYLISIKFYVIVMGKSEMVTDLPEYSGMAKPLKNDGRLTDNERANYDKPGGIGSMSAKEYWNKRVRGMGGVKRVSCAEENLLGLKDDGYYGENIFVHELSHSIMFAIEKIDSELYADIQEAYKNAMARGLYEGQYAKTNVAEYWAEGTQWWFWSNFEFYDGETRVQSPEDLKAYDPDLYHIFESVYQGHHIPEDFFYRKNLRPATR